MTTLTYPWHQAAWQQVSQMQAAQRLPHALLLTGIKGLAKQEFAKQLAASLLCLQPTEASAACGRCHSCLLLAAGTHPDHTIVSPEESGKQIKVDQIRELKASQTLMSKVSNGKTVIISHADQMNISAYNCKAFPNHRFTHRK